MSSLSQFGELAETSAGKGAIYAALAKSFTYSGAAESSFDIEGYAFNDAFDPSINEDACSLHEFSYAGGELTALFEELTRFYNFFGLGREDGSTLPDHISVELEFMHFLKNLESQSEGQEEALASLAMAQKDFISRHLLRLVRGIKSTLRTSDEHCKDLVITAEEFVAADLAQLGRV